MGLQYSIKWSLLENGIDVSYSSRFVSYLKNRGSYISIPPKVMLNDAEYIIKAELLTSDSTTNNSAEASSAFKTMGKIQDGIFYLSIDSTAMTITLQTSQWNSLALSSDSALFYDFYLSFSERDSFFFAESSPYADGTYVFDLPNGNYAFS